jgi:hypothetical protein
VSAPDVYVSALEGRATCYVARALTGEEATDQDAQNAARVAAHAVSEAMAQRNDAPSEDATVYALQVDRKRGLFAVYVQVLGQKPTEAV